MSDMQETTVTLNLTGLEYEEIHTRATRIGMTVEQYVHRQALLSGPETVSARPSVIRLRMSETERQRIQGRAKGESIPLTDYIRRTLITKRLPSYSAPLRPDGERVYQTRLRVTADEHAWLTDLAAQEVMTLTEYVMTVLGMES